MIMTIRKHNLALSALVACFFLQGNAIAGANTARLTCTPAHSESRSVRVEGSVPATIDELNLKITLGSESTMLDDNKAAAYTVEDFAKGVYTLTIHSHGSSDSTILYAVPNSVVRKNIPNGIIVKFLAYLKTPNLNKDVKLNCTYHYEI
jgi:hypothetical protein